MPDTVYALNSTLQSAAVATGNGTPVNVGGLSTLVFQVSGTFVGTISWEGTLDGANWLALSPTNLTTAGSASTATVPGIYLLAVAGLDQVRARISAYTSGNITVIAKATAHSGPSSAASIGTVNATVNVPGTIVVEEPDGSNAVLGTLANPKETDPDAASAAISALLRGILFLEGAGLPSALETDALKVWLVSALNSLDDSVTAVQGDPGAVPWPVTETKVAPFITHRRFNLPTSGTAVRLSVSSVPLSTGVFIKAADDNTARVYPSCDPSVTPGDTEVTDGMELSAGDGDQIAIDDLNKVYVVPGANDQNIYVQYA